MNNILNLINENLLIIVIALFAITIILFITVISLIVSVNKIKERYRKMMRGINSKNLEELITKNIDKIDDALKKSEDTIEEVNLLKEDLMKSVSKVSIIRYKAFEDIGSDLSFSLALLDSFDNGVIITGIYSRHDSTTYAKPIEKGISRYDLSTEEIHVLKEAINKK